MAMKDEAREFLESLALLDDIESSLQDAADQANDIAGLAGMVRLSKAKTTALQDLADEITDLSNRVDSLRDLFASEIERAGNLD